MPRTPMELMERERAIVENVELFAMWMTRRAWGWKNLDEWQREILRSRDKRMVLNCSRQSGKSSILMVKVFHTLLIIPNALVLIVAEQRQSNEDMRKLKDLVRAYDKRLIEHYGGELRLVPISDNITSIELSNGSRAIALPANEKVRGYSAPSMVVMDEAGFIPDEAFVAVNPMLVVSDGQLIIASTPKGTSGFFYTTWQDPRFTKWKVPWQMCPRISKEFIDSERMAFGDAYVKQEFACEFLDDLASIFNERDLLASIDQQEDVLADEMQRIQTMINGEPVTLI